MAVPPTAPAAAPPVAPPVAVAKADLGKRFIAMLIDGLLAGVVSLIPVIGGIIGAAYILVRDGLELDFMDRRSLGKKLIKLRPVRLDGQPMDMEHSLKRNIPLAIGAVGSIFWIIPVLGWIVAIALGLIGLIVALVEAIMVLTDPEGRRMGDKFAGTKVIEVAE
jgi:uncharacterized RDD family membrane protein YckC